MDSPQNEFFTTPHPEEEESKTGSQNPPRLPPPLKQQTPKDLTVYNNFKLDIQSLEDRQISEDLDVSYHSLNSPISSPKDVNSTNIWWILERLEETGIEMSSIYHLIYDRNHSTSSNDKTNNESKSNRYLKRLYFGSNSSEYV